MHRVQREIQLRSLGLWAAAMSATAALLGGSCFLGTATSLCESNGLRCRPGQVCAAAQAVCVDIGGCGDGIVSGEEVCDDGNIIDGDRCGADCSSDETCGNHVTDLMAGELCDDGNNVDGDGCSSSCALEKCGNRVLDPGEECDTGPEDSQGCNSNCTFVRCGDGRTNHAAGEICDTGGVVTTLCNSRCQRPVCGDGFYDPVSGEQCDTAGDSLACNGNDPDGDARSYCKIPRCGDFYTNKELVLIPDTSVKEECDGGGVNTPTCDFDCTFPVCGDGRWNVPAGEECDDSNNDNTDLCVTGPGGVCRHARCGDGYLLAQGPHPEGCDDGNDSTTDDCPSGPDGTCRPTTCGDGYINHVNMAETCDPGNSDRPAVGCPDTQTCVSSGNNACKMCL